jgi:predicted CoA-binding protein
MSAEATLHYADDDLRAMLGTTLRVAMIGASPKPGRPSHGVLRYLLDRGFVVVPVNPAAAGRSIEGQPVAATLAELDGPIDMVDVFRNSAAAGAAVDEAIAERDRLGIRSVWLQQGVRDDAAAARARDAGLKVVMDRCLKVEWARLFAGARAGGT